MNRSLLVLPFLLTALIQTNAQSQPLADGTRPTLTIEDVLKMVQVKLADDLIISQIRKNAKPFSLSAEDMVRLKTAGVSDNVIRTMIAPQDPANTQAGTEGGTGSPKTPGSLAVPSSFGYYILDDSRLSVLGRAEVSTIFGLTLADRGFAVDGIPNEAHLQAVESSSPTLIVYQQSVQINALQLSALSLVKTMKAYQFNVLNTAPQFFSNVYRVDPEQAIPINLWRPSRTIQMRIEPVDGKNGMFKLSPSSPLAPGKYAFYVPDALHGGDMVFSASVGRQSSVWAFEVTSGPTSPDREKTSSRPKEIPPSLTGLVEAAQKGDVADIRRILDSGANIEDTRNGSTALISAAYWGQVEVVRLLLARGANVNAANNGGTTPVIWAASRGHTEVLNLLIQAGADLKAKTNSGGTALSEATRNKHADIVKILKKAGAR